MNSATLVQKLWNYCNVLRDDGMSYGDYVEQLTYLLFSSSRFALRPKRGHKPSLKRAEARFLKMADERSRPPYNQSSLIPAQYAWPTLLAKDGDELFDHYRHTLESLDSEKGTLAPIFNKVQNKFDWCRPGVALTLRTPCGRPISDEECQYPGKLRSICKPSHRFGGLPA